MEVMSNLQGENSTWLIFIQINWKVAFNNIILQYFHLFNRLSAFVSYKIRCEVQGCSILQIIELVFPCTAAQWARVNRTSGGDLLRRTRQVSPHKEGSWSARIILKTDVLKEASTWKNLDADSWRLCSNRMEKIIARAIFSMKSSKRHQRITFSWKSVSEWVITSTRTRGKPHFR